MKKVKRKVRRTVKPVHGDPTRIKVINIKITPPKGRSLDDEMRLVAAKVSEAAKLAKEFGLDLTAIWLNSCAKALKQPKGWAFKPLADVK